jgi:hypothetical protein
MCDSITEGMNNAIVTILYGIVFILPDIRYACVDR